MAFFNVNFFYLEGRFIDHVFHGILLILVVEVGIIQKIIFRQNTINTSIFVGKIVKKIYCLKENV
uniref:7TM_GPCR_Srx domain-containing protein n=1 Tax=Strongyloides papillosus TaxID=174720 RepID=A0A0N5CE80_STREA